MGVGMSFSKFRAFYRPLKNYNIEDRAMKEIAKDKPKIAPKHNEAQFQEILSRVKSDPKIMEKQKIDPELLKKLESVYMTSSGDNPTIQRKMPEDRKAPDESKLVYGFPEPVNIPKGKYSTKQMLELILRSKENPEVFTAEKLAKMYQLDVELVKSILKYFYTFSVAYPPEKPKIDTWGYYHLTGRLMELKEPKVKKEPEEKEIDVIESADVKKIGHAEESPKDEDKKPKDQNQNRHRIGKD